jgi:hypothetical protein
MATKSPFQKGANPQTPDPILYKMYKKRGCGLENNFAIM